MTAAQLQVVVDDSSLQLSGPLTLGGVPLTAHWNESFAESPKVRSVVEAEIPRIDDAERARFGLDIDEVVEGPLKASVSMVRRDEGVTTLRVRSEEHTSELQSLMRTSYAVFCL